MNYILVLGAFSMKKKSVLSSVMILECIYSMQHFTGTLRKENLYILLTVMNL